MANDQDGGRTKLEPNAKPFLLKRIISDGFDTVAVFILFMLFSMLAFHSPLAKTYDRHNENCVRMREDAVAELGNDPEAIGDYLNRSAAYQEERFAANLHAYLLKLLAGFAAEAAVLLVFPLVLKDRCTPGKRMTGIMPFSPRKRARASRLAILGRFAFLFLIDSAFLYLYTGIYTFLLVPVIRLTEMLLNEKNKTVCDAVSGILIIETSSYDGID